jgi:hypothetical protein
LAKYQILGAYWRDSFSHGMWPLRNDISVHGQPSELPIDF